MSSKWSPKGFFLIFSILEAYVQTILLITFPEKGGYQMLPIVSKKETLHLENLTNQDLVKA